MVQNTKTISILSKDAPPPTAEAKTVSISLQLDYAQILELALQLTKEHKEQLMKDLAESMPVESENTKEVVVQETVETDGDEEKQAYQSWLDKDFFKLNSATGEEINLGEVEPINVDIEDIKKLQERYKKAVEKEGASEGDNIPNPISQ